MNNWEGDLFILTDYTWDDPDPEKLHIFEAGTEKQMMEARDSGKHGDNLQVVKIDEVAHDS